MEDHCFSEHRTLILKLLFTDFPAMVNMLERQESQILALKEQVKVLEEKMNHIGDPNPSFLKPEDLELLKSWINPNHKKIFLNLLFKSSVHGDSVEKFHAKCDNKGPTITVVKTDKDFILGGFTSISWSSEWNDKYIYDPSAFLFSLTQKRKLEPLKKLKKDNIYLSKKYGPSFYWSLLLWREGNVKENLFGYFQYNSFNLGPNEEEAGMNFIGTPGQGFISFNVTEMEVYAVDGKY